MLGGVWKRKHSNRVDVRFTLFDARGHDLDMLGDRLLSRVFVLASGEWENDESFRFALIGQLHMRLGGLLAEIQSQRELETEATQRLSHWARLLGMKHWVVGVDVYVKFNIMTVEEAVEASLQLIVELINITNKWLANHASTRSSSIGGQYVKT